MPLTLPDLTTHFVPPSAALTEDGVRGPALALAQHWLMVVPAGDGLDQAIDLLAAATERAAAELLDRPACQ